MAQLAKIDCVWTGFPGAPGHSVFYSPATGTIPVGPLADFFTAWGAFRPYLSNVAVPNSGDAIESTTGALDGSWASGDSANLAGATLSQIYAGPAGACVRWLTDGVVNGRRVRGRTFLVPLTAPSFQTDGTLLDSVRITIRDAAYNLVTAAAGGLHVWHRPVNGAGGSSHEITGVEVTDKVAVLRSRRD
jgi:hypothetical protein